MCVCVYVLHFCVGGLQEGAGGLAQDCRSSPDLQGLSVFQRAYIQIWSPSHVRNELGFVQCIHTALSLGEQGRSNSNGCPRVHWGCRVSHSETDLNVAPQNFRCLVEENSGSSKQPGVEV